MTVFNNAYNEKITLTDEQEKCLNYHIGEKTLMVKGYAGAGKSLVLQNLAIQYINMYPVGRRTHKIAVFTYTNALTATTREILDANTGGVDVYTSTLDRYLMDVYSAMKGPYLKMYWGKIKEDDIQQAIEIHANKYGEHRFHKLPVKFWEDEFEWMKGMNVSDDDMDYYLTIPRAGRGAGIRMSAADRITAFQLFAIYCEVNKKKGHGDWSDYPIFINKKLKEYEQAKAIGKNIEYPIPDALMFDMILIDEAQDLSLAQMLAAMGLYRKATVIAMDAHQRIYAANWTNKQLGIDTKTEWLKKSMRNTIEIDALAESLRKKNEQMLGKEDNEKRAVPVRSGAKPEICALKDSAEEKAFVVETVKRWLSESSKIRIGIIAATNKQVDKYSSWCSDAGIYHEIINKDSTFSMRTPGVKILNAYNAKGLEFLRVIIPEFNEGYFPFRIRTDDLDEKMMLLSQFRSLAYVAMTRAQETLVISCSGNEPSRFIAEMDSNLYEKKGTASLIGTYKNITRPTQTTTASATNKIESIIRTGSISKSNTSVSAKTLKEFFESKGYECIDKRAAKGGSLWIIGSKEELAPLTKEAVSLFGTLGNNGFAEHGGKASGGRPAWYITANK